MDGTNFGRLIERLYAGLDEPEPWSAFLTALRTAAEAGQATLAVTPPRGRTVRFETGTAGAESGPDAAIDTETSDGTRLRLELRGLTAARIKDGRALCEALAPHLARSVELGLRLDRMAVMEAANADLQRLLCIGVFLLEADGTVTARNEIAESILAEQDGLRLSGGILTAADAEAARRIRAGFETASKGRAPGSRPIVVPVPRPSGGPTFGVLIRPVPRRSRFGRDGEPTLLVFVGDPRRAPEPKIEDVAAFFGLTPAEASLATLLAEGISLDEAAEKLGISRNTARTHLRAIFQKTGVTRQSQLIRHLYASVAGLAAQD